MIGGRFRFVTGFVAGAGWVDVWCGRVEVWYRTDRIEATQSKSRLKLH